MKILLLDASLNGVTSLGRALSGKLKLPFFEGRDYEYDGVGHFKTDRRAPEQRNALLRKDLGKYSSWIFGGDITNWGDDLFPAFDLIVYLWLPFDMQLAAMKAAVEPPGSIFSVIPPVFKKQAGEFLQAAIEVNRRNGGSHRIAEEYNKWLDKYTCPIIELREDETTEKQRLQFVLEHVKSMRQLNKPAKY